LLPDLPDPGARALPSGALLALLLCATAPALLAPHRLSDPDTLSNLAVGRAIAEDSRIPARDPFTFSAAEHRFTTPEWLADLGWYRLHALGGEPALVAAKLVLLALAWSLAFLLAIRRGARPAGAAALLVWVALASPLRLTERNDLHACWLFPLALLLLEPARSRWRPLLLLPLGALWANLHSSFVLGWIAIASAALDPPRDGAAPRRSLLLLLAVQPLLGMVSPFGIHNYDQLLDHLRHLPFYRAAIVEWGAPSRPLLLVFGGLVIAGALSFLPACNRRQRGGMLLLAAGTLLGLGARRFPAIAGLMLAPTIAANLGRWLVARRPVRFPLERIALAVALLLAVALALRVHLEPLQPLDQRPPAAIACRIARATPGARILAPFDAGPFLIWEGWAAGLRVYADPRNSLGGDALRDYLALLADPIRFEREVEIDLVLVDLQDPRMDRLRRHLEQRSWPLLHRGERYQVFGRRSPPDAESH
jgi:hypothetical protein